MSFNKPPPFRAKSPEKTYHWPGDHASFLNPGNLRKLHHKTEKIEPILFDGLHFNIKRAKVPGRSIFCDLTLSHLSPAGPRFGIVWQPTDRNNTHVLKTPVISVDFNPWNLSSKVSFLLHPAASIRLKFSGQIVPCPGGLSNQVLRKTDCWKSPLNTPVFCDSALFCDWYGKSSTISFTSYKDDKNSTVLTIAYLRNISSNWAVGTELMYKWNKSQDDSLQMALATRYSDLRSTLASSVSLTTHDVDITYSRRINNYLQMGSSLLVRENKQNVLGSIFYQWDFYESIIRAKFISNGCIGMSFDRQFVNYSLGLSIVMNLKNCKFFYGFKLNSNA